MISLFLTWPIGFSLYFLPLSCWWGSARVAWWAPGTHRRSTHNTLAQSLFSKGGHHLTNSSYIFPFNLKIDSYALRISELKTARKRKDSTIRLSCWHMALNVGTNVGDSKIPGAMPIFNIQWEFILTFQIILKDLWCEIYKFKGCFWKHKHLFGVKLYFLYW